MKLGQMGLSMSLVSHLRQSLYCEHVEEQTLERRRGEQEVSRKRRSYSDTEDVDASEAAAWF